jgi:glycosyltransferase involved in cell wall biosynthesis
MQTPTCTVAIPVYNRIRYLKATLQSVLDQNLEGLEILVVDDGSAEEVWQQLLAMAGPRIRLHRNPTNLGLFGNWSQCLQLAKGKYFKILCSDDCLEPGTLAREIAFMEQHPSVGLLSTTGVTIDMQERVLGHIGDQLATGVYEGTEAIRQLFHFYYRSGICPFNYPSGTLMRTELAREVGGFDRSMRHVGDLDLFYKLLQKSNLGILETPGCRITIHEEQAGVQQTTKTYGVEENFEILARNRQYFARAEYEELVRLHRGLCLWYGFKLLSKRHWKSFVRYYEVARSHSGRHATVLLGFAQFLFWKAYIRLFSFKAPWIRRLEAQRL